MRKIIALLLLLSTAAYAADNAVILDPGSTITMRTKDVGSGVQSPYNILGDVTGTAIYGIAGTANSNVLTVQGIASGTAIPVSLTSTTITGTVAATQSGTWTNTVTQATAASLNATVVGTGTFAVQAAQSGTWNITNISGTISLPTGAATSAKQPALGTAGTASSDVLTVQGIASMTPLLVTLSGTNNINNISGTITLPTLASTSTKQSDGTQKTQIVDGSGNVIASTSNNLNVQCANCSGSGVSTADEASFTAGTSLFAGSGGFFQTTATSNALTTGQQGMFQVTANRALFTNLRNASGTEIGTSAAEVFVGGRGTAGSATGGVLTIQGVASMTKLLVTPDSVALPANQSVNVSQINAVTPLMGNGVTGTGSQRVTIASDNTAFSVNATLSAETTKVIGTTRTVGNVGGVLDAIGQNVAAPANWLQGGCQFNTSPTTITSTNGSPLQCDNGGKLLVNPGTVTVTATNLSTNIAQMNGVTTSMNVGSADTGTQRVSQADALSLTPASVTSATVIFTQDMTGYGSISVQVTSAGTATITYETSDDNSTWVSTSGVLSTTVGAASTDIVTTSTTVGLRIFPKRGRYFRARVSAYTSGTVTVFATLHKDQMFQMPVVQILSTNGIAASTLNTPTITMNSSSASSGNISAITAGFDDTSPTTCTENNFCYLRMSANRNLYQTIRDAAGNERGVNVTAGNALSGDVTSVAGTAIVTGGVAGSMSVGGTVATNVAITANPLNLGAQAVSSENTAVTTARQVQLVADLVGKLIVLPYSNPENFVSGVITSAMTGTTSTSLVAAPAAGLRNYLTACTFSNSHATVGTDIIIQDGSGGTTLWNVPAAAVYGGAHITFPTPLRQPTTATAIFVANVTTGASTKAACSGYKGA